MNQVRRRAEAILQLQGSLQEIHYFRGGAVTVLANKNTWVVEAENGRGKWVMNPNRPAFLPDFSRLDCVTFAPYLLGADTEQNPQQDNSRFCNGSGS